MKFHRVLLFTTIQMDITPVGEDLHVLLTNDTIPYIGCTAHACPLEIIPDIGEDDIFDTEEQGSGDSDSPDNPAQAADPDPIINIITSDEDPEKYFTIYVADQLARKTGKNVLCTGGIFVDNPDEHETEKLYENIDEMITDWVNFLND